MADILIRGMEMPEDGHVIVRIYANGDVCEPTPCPGVWEKVARADSITEGHGELIDKAEAYDRIAEQEGGNYIDMDSVGKGLEECQIVVPAEGCTGNGN